MPSRTARCRYTSFLFPQNIASANQSFARTHHPSLASRQNSGSRSAAMPSNPPNSHTSPQAHAYTNYLSPHHTHTPPGQSASSSPSSSLTSTALLHPHYQHATPKRSLHTLYRLPAPCYSVARTAPASTTLSRYFVTSRYDLDAYRLRNFWKEVESTVGEEAVREVVEEELRACGREFMGGEPGHSVCVLLDCSVSGSMDCGAHRHGFWSSCLLLVYESEVQSVHT